LEGGPLPRLQARLAHLAESLRYEEAARLRDRIEALEHVVERLRRLERLRNMELCLISPAVDPRKWKAFFVCGGAVCAVRSLPLGPEADVEIEAGLALCRSARERAEEHLTPEQAEDLLLVDGFVRRPPPELTVLPQDAEQIRERLARPRRQSAA
jgi:excinuclease UvrABC nuclease subunit